MTIYNCLARERLSPSTAKSFTAANIPPTHARTLYARVQILDAKCNYCVDGTTATTSVGEEMDPGDSFEVWGDSDLNNFSIIENGGTAAVEVTYFGTGGG